MVVIYDALPAHFSNTFTRCYLLKGCMLMKDTLRREILLQSGPHYVCHSPLSDSAKELSRALYNFVSTDNQGVPILTKASPSGKGYTNFVLLSGPHKGVFTNFSDLCMAKEGIQNPRYKGFYTKEKADKALELNSIDPEIINNALNPEPETKTNTFKKTKTNAFEKRKALHETHAFDGMFRYQSQTRLIKTSRRSKLNKRKALKGILEDFNEGLNHISSSFQVGFTFD
ncbi:hypothetical protein Fmac_032654 [Flemingia macrophylla]|uniref:Ribonuclease H1 N-terminal domain-containing protein n=1 Tax=Flemingia macrophylla TaxID=520843 RepID=A0ABD1L5H7_9FABA